MHVVFGSLKSFKACMTHISYWLTYHETRNEMRVNVPRLSVLGLFGFRKMTYTPRRREYKVSTAKKKILQHGRLWHAEKLWCLQTTLICTTLFSSDCSNTISDINSGEPLCMRLPRGSFILLGVISYSMSLGTLISMLTILLGFVYLFSRSSCLVGISPLGLVRLHEFLKRIEVDWCTLRRCFPCRCSYCCN